MIKMVDAAALKTKIESRVFDGLGSTGTLYSNTTASSSKSDYGDNIQTYASSSAIIIVPYNVIYSQTDYHRFGNLEQGEMDVAIKDGTTILIDDKIVYSGKNYVVKRIDSFPLKDVVLCKVARIKELI